VFTNKTSIRSAIATSSHTGSVKRIGADVSVLAIVKNTGVVMCAPIPGKLLDRQGNSTLPTM